MIDIYTHVHGLLMLVCRGRRSGEQARHARQRASRPPRNGPIPGT